VDLPAKIRSTLATPIFVLRKRHRSAEELTRSRATARKIGRFVAFAIAIVVLVFVCWRSYVAYEVRTRINAIRAQKLPVNGAELDVWYPQMPTAENAALKLTNAFVLLKRLSDDRGSRVVDVRWSHEHPLVDEDKKLAYAFADTNRALFNAVASAVPEGKARYPIDLSAGFATLLPHLADIKTCTQIADFYGHKAAEAGDVIEANKSCDVILKLAHTLDNEPCLISQLVRMAVVKIALRNLEFQLCTRQLSEAEIDHWLSAFAQVRQTNQITTALIGERAMTIQAFRADIFRNWRTGNVSDEAVETKPRSASGLERTFVFATGFFERDLGFFIEAMDFAIFYTRKPAPDDFETETVLRRKGAEASRKLYVLSSLILPSYSRAITRHETEMTSLD
jgi:hypothetical protein